MRSEEGLASSRSLHKSGCRLDSATGFCGDLGASHFASHLGRGDAINPLLCFIHASEYNGRRLPADWSPAPGLSTSPRHTTLCPAHWGADPLPGSSPKGPWVRWLSGAVTSPVWCPYTLPRHPALTPAAGQSLPVTQPEPSASPAGNQHAGRRIK